MKMQGYNGSQLWDTAFSIQAILETGLIEQAKDCLSLAYKFIDVAQVREDVPNNDKYYRHISKGKKDKKGGKSVHCVTLFWSGAWPFSTRDHGWPISDCTSEGLKLRKGKAKKMSMFSRGEIIF
jgi:squalene cyclase